MVEGLSLVSHQTLNSITIFFDCEMIHMTNKATEPLLEIIPYLISLFTLFSFDLCRGIGIQPGMGLIRRHLFGLPIFFSGYFLVVIIMYEISLYCQFMAIVLLNHNLIHRG